VRVLVVASPMVGHVLPLVPLAVALRDAGHDVLVATAEDGVRAASDAGLPVDDVAPGLRLARTWLGPALRRPLLLRRELTGRGGLDMAGPLFAALAARMAGRALALAAAWRPQLVVQEPLAATGALVAARAGVPLVLADANLFDPREQFAAVAGHLGPVLRSHRLDAVPEPAEVLVTSPPSVVGVRSGRPVRFVPSGGHGDVPADLVRDRPTLLVGRSTVATPGRDRLMPHVVAAAAGADVDVVLARPEPAVLRRPLPPNVRATGWLPFADVLPRVAGVVHHGGAGTLMTALAAGVPQLLTPGPGDRTVNAGLVAARGAGLARAARDISTADLERLATDPALRTAAGEVAAEIAAMPHPRDLVETLVRLAG
jgi:UDP:flavonoid glycosyltransferase YjiC (YdhE family)